MELNIRTHFETFLDKKITAIMDHLKWIRFSCLQYTHQLNLKTSQDLSKWMIMQRLERSMVTGFHYKDIQLQYLPSVTSVSPYIFFNSELNSSILCEITSPSDPTSGSL